jgi:DNA-binding CsgD family transcriptional regulator
MAGQNPHVGSLAAAGLHARGLVSRNAELLREAVRQASATDSLFVTAAAREDLAGLLSASDPQQAVSQLEGAYASYVRAGAHYDTARVRAALRALGVRKRQVTVARPQQGWDSLTQSERAVVDLVAQGATNREAASELFLSPDTINTHLRHAFAKLGVRSRVELARMAAERNRQR